MKLPKFLLIPLILFFFSSCENQSMQNGDLVVLQNKFGKFLSADRKLKNEITGNRNDILDGEVFKVKEVSNSGFLLSDFENNFLFMDSDTLKWKWESKPQNFILITRGEREFLALVEGGFLKSEVERTLRSENPEVIVHRLPRKNLFGGYLSNFDTILLALAFLILMSLFANSLYGWSVISRPLLYLLILLAHGMVAYFAITEFDFLAPWDEQFHALVGRNLSQNPWAPKLYSETILYPTKVWVAAEVWLHKQPLFLYFMAGSIQIFGASIFAVRLPSMLLMAVMGVLVYRMGTLWFNQVIGLLASLLFCFLNYKVQLLFGQAQTDHNDLAFLFFVTASIWAYFEYHESRSKNFYRAIFLFAAGAVLNKWLLGFLVYAVWGAFLLFSYTTWPNFKNSFLKLLYNFFWALLLVLPWQVYIFIRFPEEAALEMNLNARHFFEVIEGHKGAWDFHLNQMEQHYGTPYILFIGLAVLAYFSSKKKPVFWTLSSCLIGVFVFYSLAATKMPSFTFILAGIVVVFISAGLHNLYVSILHFHPQKAKVVHALFIGTALTFSLLSLNPDLLEKKFINPKTGSHLLLESENHMLFREELQSKKYRQVGLDHPEPAILFNCHYMYHISVMFYNENIIAYNTVPNEQDIATALESGRKLLIFDDGSLPDYIQRRQDIYKINNY